MNNLSKILSYSTLGTLCAFLIQLISAKILSIQDYGIIAKWLTDLAFLSIFFVFGLDNSLLYFSRKNNKNYDINFYKNVIFFTILCIIFLFLSILFGKLYYTLLILSCYILALIQTFNSYNHLNENFNKYGLINLSKNLAIFIAFLTIFILNLNITYEQYLYYYLLMLAVSFTLVLFISYKPKIKKIKNIEFFDSDYFVYGSKSMLNTFLAILLYSVTIYILDIFLDKKDIAIFFAATVLAKLAWVIPDSVGNLLYPKFLKIGVNYSRNEVMEETYFYAQLNFLINILSILIFLSIGRFIVDKLYGADYADMFYLVIILLIGNQGMVYYKILGRYLAAINQWRVQRLALIFAVIFNIFFNIILINKLNLMGAAIATALSFWVCGIIMSFYVKGSFLGFIDIRFLFRKLLNAK